MEAAGLGWAPLGEGRPGAFRGGGSRGRRDPKSSPNPETRKIPKPQTQDPSKPLTPEPPEGALNPQA